MRLSILIITILMSLNLAGQPLVRPLRQEIITDVSYLKSAVDEITVNPYLRISKAQFLREIDKAESKLLRKPQVNIIDLYTFLQPVIVKLEDGHTELYLNSYIDKTDYFVFPFNLSISTNGLQVTGINSGYQTSVPLNVIDKKLVSINGYSSQEILNTINKYCSGESKNSRLALSGYLFNTIFNLFFSKEKELNIQFNDNTSLHLIAVKKSEIKNTASADPGTPDYSYQISKDERTATLTFNSFSGLKRFKSFLSEMFSSLRQKHIKNLIIDIRNNGGGNSDLGDELLKYICPVPFTQYEKTILRYSKISKASFKTDAPADSEELKEYLNKPDGTMDTIDKSKQLVIPGKEQFLGAVFLLTSQSTFSSAADFANAFKFYKLGKIIGEETGGYVISPGEDITTRLPNSQLEFHISSSKDFDIGVTKNDWHGVRPDLEVNRRDALNYTLKELIR
ncbi:S41 family peptidase [Mucilaginibacter sp. UR6-11]|uniref:S41 family peptidase n=1 Tax=Mucilaginibacter sp. UR6-11 TaxID=1435644 RepID=UPI001E491509|nr:S41 family peptidase [Mucilaginibacter sp. UR6-11]MCC8425536.1 hypothetical protein [Mucilaginibacter sp. UR6-11]